MVSTYQKKSHFKRATVLVCRQPLEVSLHQILPLKIGIQSEREQRRCRETGHPEAMYAFYNSTVLKGVTDSYTVSAHCVLRLVRQKRTHRNINGANNHLNIDSWMYSLVSCILLY